MEIPMNRLSERERKELMRLIEAGEPLSEQWRQRLFPDARRLPEIGKEYRLVYDGLLREVLADDGSSYVHLDTKKGHYIKAILDEVFGEENFVNQIIWRRLSAHNDAVKYGPVHDMVFFYVKGEDYVWNKQFAEVSPEYLKQFFDQVEPGTGRRYARGDLTARGIRRSETGNVWRGIDPNKEGNHWKVPPSKLERLDMAGKIHWPAKEGGMPRLKRYADELEGVSLQDLWLDIKLMHNLSQERLDYPTQKPEQLVERIIRSSSNEDDIVLDCFAGSGTTAAVAEKLGRRWIAMDCGKLAIYTTQKRLFSLTTNIGGAKKDDRDESKRVEDWAEHLKGAPGLFLITEKARKGECEVTLDLLRDLAVLVDKHNLLKKGAVLSLVCPPDKLRIPDDRLEEPEGPDGGHPAAGQPARRCSASVLGRADRDAGCLHRGLSLAVVDAARRDAAQPAPDSGEGGSSAGGAVAG
jgi:hypothetical protein